MRRRDFITTVAGAAASWPLAARAQQPERIRRIGMLIAIPENDPETELRLATFREALKAVGWDGSNALIDYRYDASEAERARIGAAELVALKPDIIVANSSVALAALLRERRTIPIVFVQIADPVGAGFVASLARPGGHVTGFTSFEYAISGKWLELLKETIPAVKRVLVLRDPALAAGIGQLGAMQALAPSLRVEITPAGVRDKIEIDRTITTFAREPNGGMIVLASPFAARHREFIIDLAARHHVPTVYPYRYFATKGGLISYGIDNIDLYRRAAGYVDRILKGEKPADLPVQMPTKYELVINLKTAKALGITVPPTLLARADEVIE